ncbi:MAG: SusC/RagA family TonB-linked outer membrane protein [Bacteroidetes bacterium]|nr:SusC/RagA family TonB-linked outer membrane protein [Bacteroidota bacterium]
MRQLLTLSLALAFCASTVLAQTRSITGKVTDEKGEPIPFATILIKGHRQGVSADQNGNFLTKVAPGETVVISAAGYSPKEIKIGSESTVNMTLSRNQGAIEEVVVTALGIKRSKNTLPYAAQQITGDDVSRVRSGNAVSALSGKISGLEIRQGNAMGGSTNVVIRGNKSFISNNQALFVVDGVPFNNSNTNTATQQRGAGGYDYGNAAADINPDDIESINVLKGAASSALYGSRASNGVIMITTKQGRRGTNVTVNAGLTVGKIDKSTFPSYQHEYGAGYSSNYQKDGFLFFDVLGNGTKEYVVPTSEDASYGAKFDPNLLVYHWDAFDPTSPYYHTKRPWVAAKNDPSTFYETSISNNTNIRLDGAGDKGSYKLGFTRNDEKGTLPNSHLTKNTINFAATYNVARGLTASATVNYSRMTGLGRYGTGYSGLNLNQNFRQWYQTNVDIQEQKDAFFRTGKNVTWNWADPSTQAGLVAKYTNNYYWTRYKNYENDSRNRTFGNVALNYKATSWLNFIGRISVDNYDEIQEERIAVGSQGTPLYTRFNRHWNETNYDLLANIDKDLSPSFNLKGVAGFNKRKEEESSIFATTSGGLVVPNFYAISNSKGTAPAPTELYRPRAVDGYFAGATLTYQGFLSLDASYRGDRSSTLPENNNQYSYYSVSGSWQFAHHLQNLTWLSSGKLRANYATVGSDAPPLALKDAYDVNAPFGSTLLYSLPDTKNNPALKNERTDSKEIGLEMSFLQSRIGFDLTYYQTTTKDQIFAVNVSTASGFASKYVNAGNVSNKGIEATLYLTPVKTNDFSWNVNINYTRNRSKVISLFEGTKNLLLTSSQGGVTINATVGQPFGTIQGKKNVQLNGYNLIASTGYDSVTTTTNNVLGNSNPDWIGGIYNTFRYKRFSLGFLVDMRQGGSLFSLDMFYAAQTGILPNSAGLNDLGNPQRNSLANGGGVILPGITADGKPNTKRVVVSASSPVKPNSQFVYDASYIKLREVVLSYNLPSSIWGNASFIKGMEFSVVGRNLWLIHKNLPYADPEENLSSGNSQGYQSGAYPTTRSLGVNLKVKL